MKNRERGVNFYDLILNCKFRGLTIEPLRMEIGLGLGLAHAQFLAANSGGNVTLPAGPRKITVEDWQYHAQRNEHYLVLSCADPDLSDVSFKDMNTGSSRMAGKAAHEAIDKSCHVLIKPGPDKTGPATMLQTSNSGVTPERICAALARQLKAASAQPQYAHHFERNHPDGVAGHKLKLLTSFDHRGHQSQYLQQILQSGRLEGVELISEQHEGIDDEKGYVVTSRMVKLDVVDAEAARSMTRLKNLFKRKALMPAGPPPNKAKVYFRESESGQKKSQMFETNDLEQAFSKREIITFDTDISTKYTQVSMTVIDKMRQLL